MPSPKPGADMRRREFLGVLGGAAAVWPLCLHVVATAGDAGGRVLAQHVTPADATHLVTAFRQGLKEADFIEGQNVAIDQAHYADNQTARLPALVADPIRRPVAVIVGDTQSGDRSQGQTYRADRLRRRWRPGPAGSCRQPQPAGWQRHGRELSLRRVGRETAAVAAAISCLWRQLLACS